MSVTYPADPAKPYGDRLEQPRSDATLRADLTADEPFVPVYARRGKARGGQGKIKTWMILAPVGVLVLGGVGAMLVMGGGEEASAPLAEPAATAPVLSSTPAPTATAVAPLTTASTPAPVVAAPAPVVRDAAPLRRAAPAPVRREAARTPAAATPRAATPAPATPTGPQPYTAPSTSTLNTAPAATAPRPAPTQPPPPPIVVQPLS